MRPAGPFPPLSDAERRRSLEDSLAENPAPPEIRLFAYGSLIWDPCFRYLEVGPATLPGYDRSFCVWSVLARGTPDRPGLAVGLRPAGGVRYPACRGLLYRLEPNTAPDDLAELWRREMFTGIYVPRWLRVETREGRKDALTFVVEPAHPQFAGDLSLDETARLLADAGGRFGSARDYLADLVDHLARRDLADPELEALLVRVDAISSRRET